MDVVSVGGFRSPNRDGGRMTASTRHETWQPACWIDFGDGTAIGYAHDVVITDDWRDTPRGRVNFGRTVVGPRRLITRETTP
jgi:hypothetical protein